MRSGLITRPLRIAADPCASPQLSPRFLAFWPPFLPVFTVPIVFARTSAPDGPPLPYTFAAASRPNAAVRPPLAHRRRLAQSLSPLGSPRAVEVGFASDSLALSAVEGPLVTSHFVFLIYGTGIDFSRNPLIIKEKIFSNIR
jgi:hypothetical protein